MTMTFDPSTSTTRYLICDTVTQPNGSSDAIPGFTRVNGQEVSAGLEIQSSGALLIPRITTAQRTDPTFIVCNGMIVYDKTLNQFELYENGGWISIPGVIIPTVVNDIPVFANTSGTIEDSGVALNYIAANSNLFEGVASGNIESTSNFNISYGISILEAVLTGGNNTALGTNILNILESGGENVCVGNSIMTQSLTATRNVVVGFACAESFNDPANMFDNVIVGYRNLQDVSGATNTVSIGSSVCLSATSVADCVFVGFNIAQDFAGEFTGLTAVGTSALQSVQTGAERVTAVGFASLNALTTASRCTAVGDLSLTTITDSATGDDATAFGSGALQLAETAFQSTAVGSGSGTAQNHYTACLFLGYQADATLDNLMNATAIGAGATIAISNGMSLGAAGTHVGINTSSPTAAHLTNAGSEAVNALTVVDGSLPYVALNTDSVIICYPAGRKNVTIPDATATNYGRKFVIVNRSANGLDEIAVFTTGGQQINSNNTIPFLSSKTFIAVADDGVTHAPGYVCTNSSGGV